MKHYIPILAATFAFAAGCTQQQEATGTTDTTDTTSAAQQTGSGTTVTLAKKDRKFMKKAALGGMYEVALAQHVEKNASSPEVKDFAKKMITDHGRANDELKQLAEKKGFALPAQLDKDHREDLAELTKLRGPELDKKYADEMVDDHEDDVEDFRDASKEAKDPEIREWAAKTLRILEGHLVEAKRLKERLGE